MRQCIASALDHHEKVTVINAIGNHDDHTSLFLTIALKQIYENADRVTIIDNPTLLHFYRFGDCMFAIHHGHTIKMDRLPLVVASEQPKMWGETLFRYGHTGHIHHDSKKEFNGMVIESHRTLAARDAWAASMGYRAGRDMKAIIYHRNFGEVARYIVSVDMLRAANEA
jgi:DNA repair exonuclease SbcCD nuclease subunit